MSDRDRELQQMLRSLRLPSFGTGWRDLAATAEKQGWTYGQYLHALVHLEVNERKQRRVVRLLKQSRLPSGKTLETLELSHVPDKVRRALPRLCEGEFVDRGDNLLLFGLPGRGKTHVACAIGHELIRRGRAVLFSSTSLFVQRLLASKRDLGLERQLKQLDRYDAVILDDLGYVQQDRDEMEVLFTFLAERYERRSVILTSNLVFSQWERIFKDPMTTAAAIDRLVHHAVILEMTGKSRRKEVAQQRVADTEGEPQIEQAPIEGNNVHPDGAF